MSEILTSMSTEITMFVLLSVFALILTVFSSRQASSMREIERVVQDYYSMQLRSVRRNYAGSLDALDGLKWISDHVSAGLPKPIQVVDFIRAVPEIGAIDLRTGDNRRVVVSPYPRRDILLHDRRSKSAGRLNKKKKPADRIASFAFRPLLDGSRYGLGITTIESSMSATDEFFDMEANAVAKKFDTNWKMPTRLYFYVVD